MAVGLGKKVRLLPTGGRDAPRTGYARFPVLSFLIVG